MRSRRMRLGIACFLAVALGWIFHPACALCQEEAILIEIDVAPHVLNIQSAGTVVTVHTDLPYNMVDGMSVAMNGVEIQSWKADARGYFVAKFSMEEVKALASSEENPLVIGDYNRLTLEGFTVAGDYFMGEQDVLVIDVLPRGR